MTNTSYLVATGSLVAQPPIVTGTPVSEPQCQQCQVPQLLQETPEAHLPNRGCQFYVAEFVHKVGSVLEASERLSIPELQKGQDIEVEPD